LASCTCESFPGERCSVGGLLDAKAGNMLMAYGYTDDRTRQAFYDLYTHIEGKPWEHGLTPLAWGMYLGSIGVGRY
jgi:hypothetical protein